MAVALFDFDKTLIDRNSGHLWLRAEVRAGRVRSVDAAWAVYWFLRYALGMSDGLDQAFSQAVATYAGMPAEELERRSRAFFAAELVQRLRPGAEEALRRHRAQGDRVAIASSTTQFIALAAMEAWDLELAACTEIEVVDGVISGGIVSSALGAHKTTRVEEWARREGVRLDEMTFYTDSATDADLLERVGQPVVVHPDRRLRRLARERGWPVRDWGESSS
ncbi:MAG: HAD-IB family hydrolase [Deltaproteobacteria bacterium]|nr:MAG: HAD-IB family hydrolase [Deltaproteobacteria bacterium]